MASRSNLARMGAVILGASTALLFAALPASADVSNAPATPAQGAASPNAKAETGTLTGATEFQGSVWLKNSKKTGLDVDNAKNDTQEPTALMGLQVGKQTDWMYCIELTVESKGKGTQLQSLPWAQFPSSDTDSQFVANAGKVNWILHESFPSISLKTLAAAANAQGLTNTQAVEATQAAIWHFSNGADLDTKNAKKNDAQVDALYTYLITKATDLPQPTVDKPTVKVVPPSSTKGTDGSLIGPFTIQSNLGSTPLAVTSNLIKGVTLTDAKGTTLPGTTVKDGDKVYFDVAKGTGTSTASFTVTGQADVGKMFAGMDIAAAAAKPGGVKANCNTQPTTQTLIVAQSTSVSDQATATWEHTVVTTTTSTPPSSTQPTSTQPTVAPTTSTTPAAVATGGGSGSLPFTGVSLILPVGLAVILLGAGGAFLIMQRKRKRV
jgi:TQXA domain-containing protein